MHDGLLMSRARVANLIQTVAALAAIGGGMPELKARAPKYFCSHCARPGRSSVLIQSVTGARYCHRCGWFERKKRP